MPNENFKYRCELEFFGRAEKDATWYKAKATAEFTKKDFEKARVDGDHNVMVVSPAQNYEWEIWSDYPYKENVGLISESSYLDFPSREPFGATLKVDSASSGLVIGLKSECARAE